MIHINHFIFDKSRVKLFLSFVMILSVIFITDPQDTSAHGLVRDSTGKVDSILHYVPEDDPTVGTPTVFHYTIEKAFNMNGATAHLVIAHENGKEIANVPTVIGAHGVAANYTFEEVGNYDIALDLVAGDGQTYLFEATEKIKLPVEEKVSSPAEQMWLIGGSAGLAATVFVWALFRIKKRA